MKRLYLLTLFTVSVLFSLLSHAANDVPQFDKTKDLLLLNFDLKTDVDDIHTIAALDLIIKAKAFENINYFAVSGTYGVQGGLYVPADSLFDLVFKNNWTDAHMQRKQALAATAQRITQTIASGGRVWVAEAGQSDFTQELLHNLAQMNKPLTKDQIIVVQHSTWNENETSKDALAFVKAHTTYVKVPDGNVAANGSPGFNNTSFSVKKLEADNLPSSQVWKIANAISTQYNGVNERYQNDSIHYGGADFSDLVEVIWILGITEVDTVEQFFAKFNR
ncbi:MULTISPECIES: hypothetical protein [Aliiglaciecola]|uniref:hypothetical protein n=1 Tax=Aliiglaciecola TaxID=1406885 RepID=UPI001C09501C|nr:MULTISPECIES: hypothetical protein [Aliiglaciecola]MBU2879915.1 hypothetical protein [Aliiglaciecola lipolytica]MDO6712401.1 hypothetical protein [Aliiglaciecola sp. 2_MG-2023]MDO6753395.1 hypothetical protein [Aliiglaciecola sp. 1_MG-2023]